jgi:hypothetical protein
MKTLAEHWGSRRIKVSQGRTIKMHHLEIATVQQFHSGGCWYASCFGLRVGGAHASKRAAMIAVTEWLREHWNSIELRKPS